MQFPTTVILSLLCTLPLQALPPDIGQRLQAHLDERVARELNQALIVGVVSPSGETYFQAGTLTPGEDVPPTPTTLFQIGDVTKVFTALCAADLVRHRRLTWHTAAANLLPTNVQPQTLDNRAPTLHHLATHASGLPRVPLDLGDADPVNPYANYPIEALLKALPLTPLAFPPGERFLYSQLGYGLLAHLLEIREDQSYRELIENRIAAPLGLKDTTDALSPEQLDRLAPGHRGVSSAPAWQAGGMVGAVGLYSTPADLLTLIKAQMGLHRTSLTRSLSLTQQSVAPTGDRETMLGYGWQITTRESQPVYWQSGSTGAYSAFIGFNPGRQVGVVVLSNNHLSVDEIGFYVLSPELYPLGEFPRIHPVAPEILENYVGTYVITPESKIRITRQENRLYAQFTGQPKYRLYSLSSTRFSPVRGDLILDFGNTNRRGNARQLRVEENFRTYVARPE